MKAIKLTAFIIDNTINAIFVCAGTRKKTSYKSKWQLRPVQKENRKKCNSRWCYLCKLGMLKLKYSMLATIRQ